MALHRAGETDVRYGFVESLNGRFWNECHNAHLFADVRNALSLIAACRDYDNHPRPHTSLDWLTPWEYH